MNMNRKSKILIALGTGLLIGGARWILECLCVAPLIGPDPQLPIWYMISAVASIFIAVTIAPSAWLFLYGLDSQSKLVRFAASLPFLALLIWYSTGFVNLMQLEAALTDSANPNTKADRLRELANYKRGPGYEIDNRIAKHKNTPPDVLRSLHKRPDQVGTEICLAENPNTPDEVLLSIAELAKESREWSKYYLEALKKNPRYAEVFGSEE